MFSEAYGPGFLMKLLSDLNLEQNVGFPGLQDFLHPDKAAPIDRATPIRRLQFLGK